MTTGHERDNRVSIQQAKESFNTGLRSPDYERIHGDDRQLRTLIEYLSAVPGGAYLDLATGAGYVAFALAEECPDCHVVGADIADEVIAANAERATERGLTNLEFRVVDGIHLPFADYAFDGVVCRYAFHHFPEPQATLAGVHRVLKPGGRLVVADAVRDEADTVDFINAFQTLRQDGHVRMHLPDALIRLLVDAGFEERCRHLTAITFPRQLDAAYRELLAKTPPAITDRYLLEVKGDEALMSFDVLNVALRKRP
jgi:ubiquinone/menaquinone biosynthesis C-methylase UbiE